MASTRRLAAILAADVAGYSRLMGVDEEGTHERLQAHLRELIAEHRGRTVKNTGDGVLAGFASVVNAVATAIQRGMVEREPEKPDERRIRFRIGVNLGDVIVEEHDIFGDGVNLAARLEALAEPGGICISRMVRDQIRDKLPYPFEDMGEQQVKNIAQPVRVYVLRPQAVANLPASIGSSSASSISQPAIAPRLSVVVLPFANLGDDPEQQYFADGITEDLTTDLSRIPDMLVISRNTAFAYRNRSIDARQIGRELGVRYVLEGSVRRAGDRVRINAQLIDADTGAHLWAERFDRELGNFFDLQDEVTGRLANTLGWELIGAETTHPTNRPDALDYILRGRAANARQSLAETISLFEHALALDPSSVEALGRLANALVQGAMAKDPPAAAADIQRSEELIDRALAASPRDPIAHHAKGRLLLFVRRSEEAIPEFEIALAGNRNNPGSLVQLSMCKYLTGGTDQDAIALTERAIRLSPRDPAMWWWCTWIGFVHLLQSRAGEAIVWLKKGRIAQPRAAPPRFFLAAAFGFKGERELARAEYAQALKLLGSDRYSTIARTRTNADLYTPALRDRWETVYIPGIRAAGVPEE
jgi:TolB-like protein/class 3 adenylate cyclase/Flp pilus assembly protein TadD